MERFELCTPRLRLRPCVAADVDALHALWTDAAVRRYLWDDVCIEREQAEAVVQQSLASFTERGFGQWLMHPSAGRELIGFCGLRRIDETVDVELLYGLYPGYWGRGLASEAADAVLGHAFGPLALPRVVGRTDAPNHASVRVLERIGMAFEGEHLVHGRPTLCFAISRAAYQARHARP